MLSRKIIIFLIFSFILFLLVALLLKWEKNHYLNRLSIEGADIQAVYLVGLSSRLAYFYGGQKMLKSAIKSRKLLPVGEENRPLSQIDQEYIKNDPRFNKNVLEFSMVSQYTAAIDSTKSSDFIKIYSDGKDHYIITAYSN